MTNLTAFKARHFLRAAACLIASAMLLSGCGSTSRTAGRAAPAGAAQGATATASGPLIAALDGGIIGRDPSIAVGRADRQRALEAEYRALEAAPGGQPVTWAGGSVKGSVVAAAPYQVGSQNCRQYSHTVTIDGRDSVARGAACRNSDGTWTPLT